MTLNSSDLFRLPYPAISCQTQFEAAFLIPTLKMSMPLGSVRLAPLTTLNAFSGQLYLFLAPVTFYMDVSKSAFASLDLALEHICNSFGQLHVTSLIQ